MITAKIGSVMGKVKEAIVDALAARGFHPNFLTFLGLVVNCAAGVCFAYGYFRTAGAIVFFAGAFDMIDGAVARKMGKVTKFGAFFDSVIDRYSDMALLIGIAYYYASVHELRYVVLAALVIVGSIMVSYTRARAENLIPSCKVGFWERPERIVLLIIGALFGRVKMVLWILAVVTQLTVFHRIYFTWKETTNENQGTLSPEHPSAPKTL
jgi:CDP-diacylglycerol--glycerol-3-phosphate 3-phosphatidyltransferase